MDLTRTIFVAAVVPAVWLLFKKLKRSDVADMPGPDTSWSFMLGHLKLLFHSECGHLEKLFFENYGGVVRFKVPFMENRLWIADPKALHHVLQATNGIYVKPANDRELQAIITDEGLLSVEGITHRRQRKAMMPAFGLSATKELLPRFSEVVEKVESMWKDLLADHPDRPAEIDVADWLGRGALDIIGNAAFEYDFGALDGKNNPLTRSYLNLIGSAFGIKISTKNLFFSGISGYFPSGLLTWLFERDNSPGSVQMRENGKYGRKVAKELIEVKRKNIENGELGKDVLSLLIKESGGIDGMSDVEIASQVRTMMLAGHETTAKTMAFMFWELAKNPEYQTRIRAELDDLVAAKGDANFTVAELDSMPNLNAVIKETLRLYPSVPTTIREAFVDDTLPLSKSIVGRSGKVYNEIFIPKGTAIHASFGGYNMNPDVWGPDVWVFKPDRWLGQSANKSETPLGVYGSLMTFSTGDRSCIGWRFALLEMQLFMARLVREFQFSVIEGKQVHICGPNLMIPTIVGEEDKGSQLPLKVTLARKGIYS